MPSGTPISAARRNPPEHPPDGDADVPVEAVHDEQAPAGAEHRERIGEERRAHEAAHRGDGPGGEEDPEERDPERDLRRR